MDLLDDVARRAARYLRELPARAIWPDDAALAALDKFVEPMPRPPAPAEAVLAMLDELGSPATVASAGPRYFGYVVGGALPSAVAANWLAAAWDQNAHHWAGSPVATRLEEVALGWVTELAGLPQGTGGAFVTGASIANFCALAAARHALLGRLGWDVEARGLYGAPEIQVVVGEEVHSTVLKAIALLGLGRERVVRVPADAQGRMRADAVPEIHGPAIVCLQAGNVNTGACDPMHEIIPSARAAGAWVHVDAAFGFWAAASPRYAALVEGMALADSWATDAHKWLNVPYDCGLALVRDPAALRAAMSINAAYLPDEQYREPSRFGPELSRRARGVEVWAALKHLGREGLAALVERCCEHAQRFAAGLTATGYTILNEVALNQVLVSFGSPAQTRRVVAALQAEGTCWCSGTEWQGHTAMRISVTSWATTAADVEQSLDAILRVAAQELERG
ncbi:MAG TPA: aminotransferase class V-fold PLP-dependent enzyme [Gammaproteobacteria bacterium]|nr:aminotransferase class V-fold PLP-dependent enzyme [Gammaproteobacteria bacterium]